LLVSLAPGCSTPLVPPIVWGEYSYVPDPVYPNDPEFSRQWYLHNTGQEYWSAAPPGTEDADIDAPEAWGYNTDCSAVVVAVIDSGVDYNHPELVDNMWTNPGEIPANGIDDDGNGYVDDIHGYDFAYDDGDPLDDQFYGTAVAGVIGAKGNDSFGITGVCWRSSIMAIKPLDMFDGTTTLKIIQSIDYAIDNGADIINFSWYQVYTQATAPVGIKAALQRAYDEGVLVVASVGDAGLDPNGPFRAYPASYSYQDGSGNVLPDAIIAVVASDSDDALSAASYYDTPVDLAAPGYEIYVAVPALYGSYGYLSNLGLEAALVSGAAALLWSYNPKLTADQVKKRIIGRADVDDATSIRRLNVARSFNPKKGYY